MKNICSYKNLYTMYIVAPFIVAKKEKQSKCPSAEERINNKRWWSHNMEYYSAMRQDWPTDSCDHMHNWKYHAKCKKPNTKTTYGTIPLPWNVQNRQTYSDRKHISDFQGLVGGGIGEWLLMGMRLPLGGWKVLELDHGDGCATL